jgi:hypothetical protein
MASLADNRFAPMGEEKCQPSATGARGWPCREWAVYGDELTQRCDTVVFMAHAGYVKVKHPNA